MQKKPTQFKLPQIKKTPVRQSSKILSKTTSEHSEPIKVRPASSNKVEDLEKKLFSKLQSFQGVSKKNIAKKTSKILKQLPIQKGMSFQPVTEKYEKLQKLMPDLYTKLIETKKESYLIQPSSNCIFQPQTYKSQNCIKRGHSQQQKSTKQQQQSFITTIQQSQEMASMSQQQMQQIYKQYSLNEGFGRQTTNLQLKQLGDTINDCQKDMQELRKSMQGLIQQIGLQMIANYENQSELN